MLKFAADDFPRLPHRCPPEEAGEEVTDVSQWRPADMARFIERNAPMFRVFVGRWGIG